MCYQYNNPTAFLGCGIILATLVIVICLVGIYVLPTEPQSQWNLELYMAVGLFGICGLGLCLRHWWFQYTGPPESAETASPVSMSELPVVTHTEISHH